MKAVTDAAVDEAARVHLGMEPGQPLESVDFWGDGFDGWAAQLRQRMRGVVEAAVAEMMRGLLDDTEQPSAFWADLHFAFEQGVRDFDRYTSERVMACPPSRVFPISNMSDREFVSNARSAWRLAFPERTVSSFTWPRVEAVFAKWFGA